MDEKLQQAIVAARTGDGQTAQALLAQALENDPNNAEAWFLLGNLVESDARQAAYLQKAVALNPDHPQARARLAAFSTATLVDAERTPETAEPIPAPIIQPYLTAPAPEEEAPLPDWLQELSLEPEEEETPLATAEEKERLEKSPPAKPEKAPARAPKSKPTPTYEAAPQPRGDVWLTRLLILLIIIAVIVLGILVYLVLTG